MAGLGAEEAKYSELAKRKRKWEYRGSSGKSQMLGIR